MPPKPALLKLFKKDVKAQKAQTQKDIDILTLTEVEIQNEKITILKQWAKKLEIPNLQGYNTGNIAMLRKVMITALKELKESKERDIDVVDDGNGGTGGTGGTGDDDDEKLKQYIAIEKFLKSYQKDPTKTTSVYGEIGTEFNNLWKGLLKYDKIVFAHEYFTLNVDFVDPRGFRTIKKNPLLYLQNFIAAFDNTERQTPESLTISYLTRFLKVLKEKAEKQVEKRSEKGNEKGTEEKITVEETDKMIKIKEHILFPVKFLEQFNSLPMTDKLRFAKIYISTGGYRSPVDVLKTYMQVNLITESKDIERINIGGYLSKRQQTENEDSKINKYPECTLSLRRNNWLIKPVGNVDPVYTSLPAQDGLFYPSDTFYKSICMYHTYVKSPKESILIMFPLSSHGVPPIKKSSVSFEIYHDNGTKYSPTLLNTELRIAQTGNIFTKLSPLWILETPLHQVDKRYVDSPNLFLKGNFDKIIIDLQKHSSYVSFKTYLMRFIDMFFPFISSKVIGTPSGTPSPKFFVVDHIVNGYMTQEAYANMTKAEKAPNADIPKLNDSLAVYLQQFSYAVIKNVDKSVKDYPEIEYLEDTFKNPDCPEEAKWYPKDLLVHEDKCLVIPVLMKNFKENNFTNPHTGTLFDKSFIEMFKERYGGVGSKKVYTKPVKVINSSGDIVETVDEVYVDKELHDKINPITVDVSPDETDELSAIFNKYFGIAKLVVDPVKLIENLIKYNPSDKCIKCNKILGRSDVKSIANRTDGTTMQVSFCDYKCMVEYEFIPMSTIEEELDIPEHIGNIIESV